MWLSEPRRTHFTRGSAFDSVPGVSRFRLAPGVLPVLMHVVSVVNLLACWSAPGRLSAKGRRRALLAGIIDALVVGAFTCWALTHRR